MKNDMNYHAIVKERYENSFNHTCPEVGEHVYVHKFEDDKFLIYRPYNRRAKQPVFDVILTKEEAAKHFSCTSVCLDFDVRASWSKMDDDRYW